MYPYYVYPVGHVSNRYEGRLFPVSRVTPVEASRSVTPSPSLQYGNAGQPQRIFAAQLAVGYRLQSEGRTESSAHSSLKHARKKSSAASKPIYVENLQELMDLRVPGHEVAPDYIEKALDKLELSRAGG